MKVALLTDGVWPQVIGGMQKHSYNLLRGLVSNGVSVLLYHGGPDQIKEELELADDLFEEVLIKFSQKGSMPGAYLKSSYQFSYQIAEDLLNRTDIDFIYAQGFTAWRLCELKSKGTELAPIGVNFHGLEMFQMTHGIKNRLIQWMFRGPVKYNLKGADICYSLGGKLTGILEKLVQESKVCVMPIAVDKRLLKSDVQVTDGPIINVIFIGRYEHRKGLEFLYDAIDKLSSLGVYHFHFVGPIPRHKRKQSESCTFHGMLGQEGDLLKVLDDCQVLCLPSLSEGMPTVILEAMSRGLAIAASDVGAVGEIVDSENGFLLPPGDSDAIANALKSYSEMGLEKRRALGDVSRTRVESQFTWEIITQKTLNHFTEILRG